ncbi:MAG: hypothetical protein ACI8ZM_000781 [Crocinitomix sp.]|jgi:hypothetical protein
MSKYLFKFFVFTILIPHYASAQSFEWGYAEEFLSLTYCREYGTNHGRISERIIDSEGNIIRVGSFQGTLDFDPGPGEFLLTNSTLDGNSGLIRLIVSIIIIFQ